ncbi:hypothetical protein ACFP6A_12755 [Quadrisphaera sp. GCM10027208]|uniref:hypothetical protein n=1 Tax=Quadrisphaera sp. GCM10027208 TaxID=3273423 RepID=UPI0036076A41
MPALRLLPDLEDALCQLSDVRAVSVVTDPDARPQEIHVLANPGKPAKQLVRDVQSVALAQFDLDLDHRIVSVVQIGDRDATHEEDSAAEATADRPDHARVVVTSIATRTAGGQYEVEVTLGAGDDAFTGSALGPLSPSHRPRIVASATLAALRELLGMRCELETADLVRTATREVALVVLVLGVPRVGEQVLTGSAPVRGDHPDAVARAVLDALNRTLAG